MERLNEKHEGESPKVTLRMDPSMIKVVDREAKRIDGTRSAALRSLVMRATGDGVTAAIGGAMVAQAEVSELKARLEKAEHERDEAIAQRKEADRSANRSAKKTMDAWDRIRKDLDAARTRVIAVTDAHDEMARERDAAVDRSRVAIEARDAAKRERDEALAEVDGLKQRIEAMGLYSEELRGLLRNEREKRDALKAELDAERKISEGRREMLLKKSDELRAEWLRAERAEGKVSRLKTAHKIIAETPAEVAEVVREAEQPVPAQGDDAAVNDALRARYRALSIPLRAFVSKHNITRTPFQKWVAGERDMHGETLAKYEAAIRSEE